MTPFTIRQQCESDAKEFLTPEVWNSWKQEYDAAMSYRKSLKGKPTEEQRVQLSINAEWIAFCDHVLWHSARLAQHDLCSCKSCAEKRKGSK